MKMIESRSPGAGFLFVWGLAVQSNQASAWTSVLVPARIASATNFLQSPQHRTVVSLEAINRTGDNKDSIEDSGVTRRNLLAQAGMGLAGLVSSLGLNLVSPEEASAIYSSGFDSSEARRIEVFEKVAPSVVFIDTFVERKDIFTTNIMEVPLGTGSGFVWDYDGHIVTNFHVVREAKFAQVAILTKNSPTSSSGSNANKPLPRLASSLDTVSENPFEAPPPTDVLPYTSMRPSGSSSRSVYKARVVGVDPSKDIAVLKVDAPRKELFPISVGSSTGIKVGQQALAIGNPFGLDHTLTSGIVSGLGREVRSPIGRPISNVIQSDCAINPGKSILASGTLSILAPGTLSMFILRFFDIDGCCS